MEVSRWLHAPAALTTGKNSSTHWIGSWCGHADSIDVLVENKFPLLPPPERYLDLRRSKSAINPLAPNDTTYIYIYILYIYRTAQLTSRRCILNIYSTNILTEYFKHPAHSPFFFLSSRCRLFHNAIFFGLVLNTGCAKILKNYGAKGLRDSTALWMQVKENKMVSCSSQTQQYVFILFYLVDISVKLRKMWNAVQIIFT